MASVARNERTINPDTGQPESQFRELVRDALGLPWEVRDAAIFAELRRLKATERCPSVCLDYHCPVHGTEAGGYGHAV